MSRYFLNLKDPSMSKILNILCVLCVSLFPMISLAAQVSIGVLAYNGKPQALQRWQATADYLGVRIPDTRFLIKPLTHQEFQHAINKGELDFLLTNPGHYVQLEVKAGAIRLASFQTRFEDRVLTRMSSVIFSLKDKGIDTLDIEKVKGKTLAAVGKDAFGGFQLAQKVFLQHAINPLQDMQIKWLGFPHADVVHSVLSGKADIGVVRSGVLEKMAGQGLLDLSSLKILNQQVKDQFPFLHSTGLYPEWPFARLPSTDPELSKRVVLALLQMPDSNAAAIESGGTGWTIPLNYSSVHDLFKSLQIEPYPPVSPNFKDFWLAYRQWIIVSFLLLLFSLAVLLRMFKVNQHLNTAKQALQQHQNVLEDTVKQRTDELLQSNLLLQQDIEQRIATEKTMHEACDTLQGFYMIASRHDLDREQRLQSILDMARQTLKADRALLSRWDATQQQFVFCSCSPEGQITDDQNSGDKKTIEPLCREFALEAISTHALQNHKECAPWQSYLACPIKGVDGYQRLFEFVALPKKESGEAVNNGALLNSEIHQRILKLLTFWVSHETALMDKEQQSEQQLREFRQRFEHISPREKQVLDLLIQGESNKSMARYLNISSKTVELHRANLLKKTDARSSIELVKMAIQSGLSDRPGKNPRFS